MMKNIVLLFSDNTWEFCSELLIDKKCKEHQWNKKFNITKGVLICYCSKNEYRDLNEEKD